MSGFGAAALFAIGLLMVLLLIAEAVNGPSA
jgi:hypothetical protein